VKKLLVGLTLIALGLIVVACSSSPAPMPSGTATVATPPSAVASANATPPASPVPAVSPTEAGPALLLSAGTYAVGTGIPAGTYEGQALSEETEYQISTDKDGKDVVKTSPKLTGNFNLKLKEGQYLQVTGVMKIKKEK
jgi:hypothetical protein